MFIAGVGRTELTPFPGVELTGWGYYIERVWQQVRDPLYATALVCEDDSHVAVVLALDLMVIDAHFARNVREQLQAQLGIPPEAVLLTCSHSHNAPAAGGLRGVGECDPAYEAWAAQQAAAAALVAWENRVPAQMVCGSRPCPGLTFNRTRSEGVVDDLLTIARIDRVAGGPLAVLVNFAAHPTVMTDLGPWDVSRDVPGEICDQLEAHYPGAFALYLQGACGDTNFLRSFQTPENCHEPANQLAAAAIEILETAQPVASSPIACSSRLAQLPTRRWTREEIEQDRREAQRRLDEQDFTNWQETLGRSMTNRPADMITRHGGDEAKAVQAMCRFHLEWTMEMLIDFESRPEVLETEVQALRIGELFIVANAAEFFSPFARAIRESFGSAPLMIACYSNGRIGYLPDAYDIEAKSYAGLQSPKYCNQFPFTAESGPTMCQHMLAALEECQRQQ